MKKKGVVVNGFYRVYLCNHCGDVPETINFASWYEAYHVFRFHVSFLGWHFGRVVYVNYPYDMFIELVYATRYNGLLCCVHCNQFLDVYPLF